MSSCLPSRPLSCPLHLHINFSTLDCFLSPFGSSPLIRYLPNLFPEKNERKKPPPERRKEQKSKISSGGFSLKQAWPQPQSLLSLFAFLLLGLFSHITSDDTHARYWSLSHFITNSSRQDSLKARFLSPLEPFGPNTPISTALAYQDLSCFNCKLLSPPFLHKDPQKPNTTRTTKLTHQPTNQQICRLD